jgi:hypothetical protein
MRARCEYWDPDNQPTEKIKDSRYEKAIDFLHGNNNQGVGKNNRNSTM